MAIATGDAWIPETTGTTVITLSADPAIGNAAANRYYRYDRAGLLARLAALRLEQAA
ncbi:MAG: hypothetical protein ACEQR8_12075 [Cypionkella sp.]